MKKLSGSREMASALTAMALFLGGLMVVGATPAHAQPPVVPLKPVAAPRASAEKELLVKLKPGQGAQDIADIAAKLNARVVQTFGRYNLYRLKTGTDVTPAQAQTTLSRSVNAHGQNLGAKVSNIQPNFVYTALDTTPNDTFFYYQYSLFNDGTFFTGAKAGADIKAKPAWDLWKGSSDVYVAVIDTGVDYNHDDLIGNIWVNPGESGVDEWGNDKATNGIDDDGDGYVDDVHGINASYDPIYFPYPLPGDPYDDNGHGTHVSGTIGARTDNGLGVAGINWDVKIIALKFLNSGGYGYTSDAVECLDYLHYLKTVKGLNIIASNNSWGGGGFDQALYDAIKQSGDDGMLFIAAAGNAYGNDNDVFAFYPASYDLNNIVSVAATDANDKLAAFSNVGKTTVDLGAPGDTILSTIPTWWYGYSWYAFFSGTSMATPHVTGAAALLHGYDPSLTAAQIKKRLMDTGDPLKALKKTVSTRRLNLYNLLTNYVPTIPPPTNKLAVDVTTDSSVYYAPSFYSYNAIVTIDEDAVSGATLKVVVTGPTGTIHSKTYTTGASGRAVYTGKVTVAGTYTVTATATKGGQTATKSVTFDVY